MTRAGIAKLLRALPELTVHIPTGSGGSFSLAVMSTTNRYRYESPIRLTVFLAVFYIGLSAWMAYLAKGHAELRAVFIGLSVIFGAFALVVPIRRLAFPYTLELTDDAILLPRGLPWPGTTTIPYADIIGIQDYGNSLWISTSDGGFGFPTTQFDGYRAVRDGISVKTAIEFEPPHVRGILPKFYSDTFPGRLVQWVEPEDWSRLRRRAEVSKPVLYQLRTELWCFVRCFAFCRAFIIVCPGLLLLSWIFTLAPFQFFDFSVRCLAGASFLASIFTLLHWLDRINPVRPETIISFRDRGITSRLPSGQEFSWNYRQLCGWAVIERQFRGRPLQILLLRRLEKGQACDEAIALPDATIRDQVLQILKDRQVPQAPDLKPSWEAK
ncbi:MAG TPA: hypothetical protein VKU82_12195 [Planctomycetaceae bacterium]|nr:hypothetical protein [Planctomycetaceae bacterium]